MKLAMNFSVDAIAFIASPLKQIGNLEQLN